MDGPATEHQVAPESDATPVLRQRTRWERLRDPLLTGGLVGDLTAAASSNLLFVALIPVIVVVWLRWTGRAWSGAPVPASRERFGVRAGVWIMAFAVVL